MRGGKMMLILPGGGTSVRRDAGGGESSGGPLATPQDLCLNCWEANWIADLSSGGVWAHVAISS